MDNDVLMQLGVNLALVIFAAGIVKPSVDQLRGAFTLGTGPTVVLCYLFSFILSAVLVLATGGTLSYPLFGARFLVTGWLTATYSAMITDVHNAAKKKLAEADDEQEVEPVAVISPPAL